MAQPITPLPLGVVLFHPGNPFLMGKHGKPRPAPEDRPPPLQPVNSTPRESGVKSLIALINCHC